MKKLLTLVLIFTLTICNSQTKKNENKSDSKTTILSNEIDSDIKQSRIAEKKDNVKSENLVKHIMSEQNQFTPKAHYINPNKKLSLMVTVNKENVEEVKVYVFDFDGKYLRSHKMKYSDFLEKTK